MKVMSRNQFSNLVWIQLKNQLGFQPRSLLRIQFDHQFMDHINGQLNGELWGMIYNQLGKLFEGKLKPWISSFRFNL